MIESIPIPLDQYIVSFPSDIERFWYSTWSSSVIDREPELATAISSFEAYIKSELEELHLIKKIIDSPENVIGYKAIGTISASDYLKLEPEVKALVEKVGNICMLIDLSEFKWEKMEAWVKDLKFGSEFHNKIQKMAIVGDKTWEKWITHLAKPFYARDAKFFHTADIDKAWAWLRE